ncbi:MAG: hypothetical protein HRK26_01630 [Rickettsiaceae bacterium H1]|nr:hypothetical protein [Rickettsiaceae bacterium H1]
MTNSFKEKLKEIKTKHPGKVTIGGEIAMLSAAGIILGVLHTRGVMNIAEVMSDQKSMFVFGATAVLTIAAMLAIWNVYNTVEPKVVICRERINPDRLMELLEDNDVKNKVQNIINLEESLKSVTDDFNNRLQGVTNAEALLELLKEQTVQDKIKEMIDAQALLSLLGEQDVINVIKKIDAQELLLLLKEQDDVTNAIKAMIGDHIPTVLEETNVKSVIKAIAKETV